MNSRGYLSLWWSCFVYIFCSHSLSRVPSSFFNLCLHCFYLYFVVSFSSGNNSTDSVCHFWIILSTFIIGNVKIFFPDGVTGTIVMFCLIVKSRSSLSIYIPWPIPPVWGVADNTKETAKQWGFYSILLAMTRDPAKFGWHC